MRVSRSGIYAAGDVTGRDQFVYMAAYGAKLATKNALNGDSLRYDNSAMPVIVFTDPQVASVGLTSVEAAKRELPHRVVEYAIGNVAGAAVFADGYTGTAIAVIDTEREVLLGMTFIGSGVAEMIQAATIAIFGELPIARLWHAVPAYPTINEVWLRLLETYRG